MEELHCNEGVPIGEAHCREGVPMEWAHCSKGPYVLRHPDRGAGL